MEHSLLPFKISFQCILEPEGQPPQLRRLFRLLHREDFCKGELNLLDLDLIKSEGPKSLLNEYQMKMSMLTTGVYAKTHDLSLSPGIPGERVRTVNGYKGNIDYAASMGCGIIIGFLRGGLGSNNGFTERLSLESMLKLKPYNRKEESADPH